MKIKRKLLSEGLVITFLLFIISFSMRMWLIANVGWISDDGAVNISSLNLDSSIFHESDTGIYTHLAKSLLNGKGMNIPFGPPLTSILIAMLYYLSNYNYLIIKVSLSVIASIPCISYYFIGKAIFQDKNIALLTGLLSSISFGLLIISGSLNTEIFYAALSSITTLLMVKDLKNNSSLAVLGIFTGLTILTRSEFILFVLIYFIFIIYKKQGINGWCLKKICTLIIIVSAIVSPWTLRNYLYLNNYNIGHTGADLPSFVPVALNGPLNFAEGNNPHSTGTYDVSFLGNNNVETVFLDLSNSVHKSYILNGYKEGFNFIISNPHQAFKLLWRKFTVFIDFLSYGLYYTNFPDGLTGIVKNKADCFIPQSRIMFFINIILFISGVLSALFFTNSVYSFFPLCLFITTLFTNLLFYGLTRSGLPILPVVILYESAFIVWIYYKIKSHTNCPSSPIAEKRMIYKRELILLIFTILILSIEYIDSTYSIMLHKQKIQNSNATLIKRIK